MAGPMGHKGMRGGPKAKNAKGTVTRLIKYLFKTASEFDYYFSSWYCVSDPKSFFEIIADA